MTVHVSRKMVRCVYGQALANEFAVTAENMRHNGLSWPGTPVFIAAMKCQAVMYGDVAGAHFQRQFRIGNDLALLWRKQAVDLSLKMAGENMKLTGQTPSVTTINHVQTACLHTRIRQRQAHTNHGGWIEEAGVRIVLMQSDSAIRRRRL
jgi:hypothetical protein